MISAATPSPDESPTNLAVGFGRDNHPAAQAPYWDLSKKFLVEKTPNHMTMTRFLQGVCAHLSPLCSSQFRSIYQYFHNYSPLDYTPRKIHRAVKFAVVRK
jgi:hypothetical protein